MRAIRARLDDALAAFARLVLRVFFREIEVVGLERIPRGVPLLIVANHVNSLVDPLMILAFLGARPRVLAKSTLWSHPVVGPFLVLAGAVPVYRRQDEGAPVERNFETFARCRETLARGHAVALFPEGKSHPHPHGLPLKTGAARIALEAMSHHADLGLRIVPAGLTYEARSRFRSAALVSVGEPIDPALESSRYAREPGAAVRALTARMALGLEEVTVSYSSWEEARLIDRAVRLLDEDQQAATLSRRIGLWKRALVGYRTMMARDPARIEAVAEAVAHDDGAPPAPAHRVPRTPARFVEAPFALLGSFLNWVPYRLTGWTVSRLARTPDDPATYAIMTALFAFPLWWAALATAPALAGRPLAALTILVLAPLTGSIALRFHEARGRFFPGSGVHQATAADAALARERRTRLRDEIRRLADEYAKGAGGNA